MHLRRITLSLATLTLLACHTPATTPTPSPVAKDTPPAPQASVPLKVLCEQQSQASACLALGHAAIIQKQPGQTWLERACTMGNPRGCGLLGEQPPQRGEQERAHTNLSNACTQGDAHACTRLGTISPDKSLSFYQQACEGGSPTGCSKLATLTLQGKGILPSARHAHELYQRGCAGGRIHDCIRSAWLRADGCLHGDDIACVRTTTSRETRVEWLEERCAAGDMFTCVALGAYLEQGHGAPQDTPRAASLYKDACTHDIPWGCHGLARLQRVGLGTPKNPQHAALLFARACNNDFLAACVPAAQMHSNTAPGMARRLLRHACKKGAEDACIAWRVGCATRPGPECS